MNHQALQVNNRRRGNRKRRQSANRRLNGQFEYAWQATLAQKTHALPPAAATRADLQSMQTKLTTNMASFTAQQPAIQTYFAKAVAQLATAHATTAIQARAQAQADKIAQLSTQSKGSESLILRKVEG